MVVIRSTCVCLGCATLSAELLLPDATLGEFCARFNQEKTTHSFAGNMFKLSKLALIQTCRTAQRFVFGVGGKQRTQSLGWGG